MSYIVKVNRSTNTYVLKRVTRKVFVNRVGRRGKAATITVGTTTTLPAGSEATVENTGTTSEAVFNFGIPKGSDGDMPTDYVRSVVAGTNVTVDDTDPYNPIVSATGDGSVSFDDITDKPEAPAFTGLLVNNASFDTFPTDTAEYSLLKDPNTFAVRKANGTLEVDAGIDTYDAVVKGQLDMVEEELFQDIQTGDATTLASANTYTDTKVAGITKTYIGLGNVDNTSDANKPVSTATQAALDGKLDKGTMSGAAYIRNVGGIDTQLSYTQSPSATALVQYATGGQVRAATATLSDAAVPLAQLNTYIQRGTGFPNGVVSAPVGSIYIDTAVTNGASSWIKKSGTGNTGWQVLEGDTGWRDITVLAGSWTGTFKVRRLNNIVNVRSMFDNDGINGTAATQNSFYAPTSGFRMSIVGNDAISAASSNRLLPPDGTVYRNTVNLACTLRTAQAGFYGNYSTTDSWPSSLPGTQSTIF